MPELQTPQPAPQPLIDLRSVEEFVLKYPFDTFADLIVEQAREVGIELEIRQVHRIRDQQRQRTARASTPSSLDPSDESDSDEDDGDEDEDDGDENEPGEDNPEDQGGHDGNTEAEGAAGAGDGSAPKRRGRKPGGPDTKAGFVRSLPLSLPAREVVALALEQRNFEITEAYVSAIRSKLLPPTEIKRRRRRRKQAAPTPATPVSTGSVSKETPTDPAPVSPAVSPPRASLGPAVSAVSAPEVVAVSAPPAAPEVVAVAAPPAAPVFRSTEGVAVADVEEEFARLVLEIGLVRAEQLLVRFKERLARFVRG